MADEIASRVSSLRITEEEDKVVNFDDFESTNKNDDLELTLVGKVLTVRNYNFDALKRTLNQIWAIKTGALFRPIENGLFVVQFACRRDKEKVLDGRPWTFDQHLVMLQEVEDHVQPSNIELRRCPFWMRLYNLPMGYRSESYVRRIGGCIGDVLEVESDGVQWDRSARVRILLDIKKPLRRVQRISLKDGSTVLVDVKYERLPTFCYACGLIGHIERDCLVNQEEDGNEGNKSSAITEAAREPVVTVDEEVGSGVILEKEKEDRLEFDTTMEDLNTQQGTAVVPHLQEEGNVDNLFCFVANNDSGIVKSRKVKPKIQHSKKSIVEKQASLRKTMHEPNSGEKRKWPDQIQLMEPSDDAVVTKKSRVVGDLNLDSGDQTVEAEIGGDQLRRAL
ncbi:uncharacterized protein LOC130589567 [Beta vulgaris subsp. vulgaris]|uniref:uncharacterized protein LOC130589567 n=1 Tax=Beta vulgaris subsp. vulgaris TaxID=3555 RepID=UPI002549256C|nr:uncharacterized protein LOC130589567 [Beta vulgaris subsp. vulgaris]